MNVMSFSGSGLVSVYGEGTASFDYQYSATPV
jgi:hypothetical protein